MKQDKIATNNKLVAEFMMSLDEDGVLYTPVLVWNPDGDRNFEWRDGDIESFFYNSSWDWLMPVVDKIEEECSTELHFYSGLKGTGSAYYMTILGYKNDYDRTYWGKTRIKVVYKSIVKYIKWYKRNKQS
jgi:hypothetical protein